MESPWESPWFNNQTYVDTLSPAELKTARELLAAAPLRPGDAGAPTLAQIADELVVARTIAAAARLAAPPGRAEAPAATAAAPPAE